MSPALDSQPRQKKSRYIFIFLYILGSFLTPLIIYFVQSKLSALSDLLKQDTETLNIRSILHPSAVVRKLPHLFLPKLINNGSAKSMEELREEVRLAKVCHT